MKKLLFPVLINVFFLFGAKAQYVNIPDTNFRNFLIEKYPGCFNSSRQLDTTCASIVNEDSLTCHVSQITTVEGLRYFKNLVYLDIENMYDLINVPYFPASLRYLNCSQIFNLVSLPALPPNLEFLICSRNSNLTSLPDLPNTLKYLDCSYGSRLAVIPLLPNSLKNLNCSQCDDIVSMPALPASLDSLNCFNCTELTSLPSLPSMLRYLHCASCQLSSLPTLPATLLYLNCSSNNMSLLPALPPNLNYLNCRQNILQAIPTLPANLITLICGYNQTLTSLPAIPPTLITLNFSVSNIAAFPVLPNTLKYLDCSNNPLFNISSFPDSLHSIYCSENRLTSLPALPAFVDTLYCIGNQLTSLPALPGFLSFLDCHINNLTSLPALPNSLLNLQCGSNQLTALPELTDFISEISCEENNIYCLPELRGSPINGLSMRMDDKIVCIPNKPVYLEIHLVDADGNSTPAVAHLPLCNPTNNVFHCTSFPVMQGIVFYDNNSNGIRDAGEPVKANNRVSLSNNSYSFTNNTGFYEIGADSIGAYTLSSHSPTYFDAVPAAYNYNFSSYDTLVIKNFALQANTVIDSLAIRINPVNWGARPGFSFPYLISYENAGTTTLSPGIVFNYDVTRIRYDSSSNASVVNNGTNLSLPVGSFVPGQYGSFIAYFTVRTTAPLGDPLFAKATISANGNAWSDSVLNTISGAFDPNDKQATPALSPSQVAAGKYIDYTIRFQNTGTDTAFNIVISDTLSSNLQANTLQMLSSSHNCKATVKNNIVFFEFLNILLPDSNVNEPKSHGFVSFRIKPQSNVAEHTIIPNKAAIYFDYNAPVITNTATTEIKIPLIPVPLKLQFFTAVRQTENTAVVSWNTSNEINTSKFYIEQSFDGRNFINTGSENAKGRQYNSYTKQITIPGVEILYLRLKITDIDSRFTYSPVVALRKNKTTEPFTILNNPVKEILTIAVQDAGLRNTLAKVINGQGAVLQTVLLKNNIETVDISKFPAGVYILQTEKGSRQFMLVR